MFRTKSKYFLFLNRPLFRQILILLLGIVLCLPLIISDNLDSVFKLYNGSVRGGKFNYILIGLLGIIFICSAIRQLYLILKSKRRNPNSIYH